VAGVKALVRSRWFAVAVVAAIVFVYGVAGYMILGFGFVDAVFQTVLALTTAGFTPVRPRTPDRLYRAGADRVVSPYVTSGRHMALLALRPRVVDYLEVARGDRRTLRLEALLVEDDSVLVGKELREAAGEALVPSRPAERRRDTPEPGMRAGAPRRRRAGHSR
jgi:voltage-gated potassium channel Kch